MKKVLCKKAFTLTVDTVGRIHQKVPLGRGTRREMLYCCNSVNTGVKPPITQNILHYKGIYVKIRKST